LRLHSVLGLGLRRDIHERRIFGLLCQQRSPFNRRFVRLFVYRVAVPRIAQQKVLLLGIVLALAARTGFIDSRRVMTPDAAGDDRHRRIELLGQAHQARGAVGPTRRRGYDYGLG
jgi:hypothetical protein